MSFFKLMAGALGLNSLMALMGPTLPIHRSSFRKSSGTHRWKSRAGMNPQNNGGWWRRNAYISPMVTTERMLMRHGWWRRKVRKEGVAIGSRKNEVVLK